MPPPDLDGRRICLFGGTFDPIHSAHLRIADEARSRFRLDRILFIPASSPPHKTAMSLTPYEDRFRMVEIACKPYPAFEVSRLEDKPQRSYTVDTVKKFKQAAGPDLRLFFLIGADAFDEIETWKDWQKLIQEIEFIVVTRPGGSYRIPPGACVHRLEGLELPISSSSIRARLAAGEETPELPEAVRAFIDERGLYRTTASL
ncbi:MAG: nicotinate-nucleotide adenylyltransferase [Acidobacteriota bacterium]|nr:nicotinate-nucleotide adenylyltransferase [Acidobacteriota bacterium]